MVIRIPKCRLDASLKLNYDNLIPVLAVIYFCNSIYLVSTSAVLGKLLDAAQLLLLACIGLVFAFQRVSREKMLLRMGIIAIFAASCLASGAFPYLKHGLVLLAGINCNWSRTYKKLFHTYFWCILVVFLLGVLGILPSQTVRRGYSSFGFSHSNSLALNLLTMLCCAVLANRDALKTGQGMAGAAVVILTWLLTNSRTSLLAMFLFLILLLLRKYILRWVQPGRLLYYLTMLLPLILLWLSFFCVIRYNDGSLLFRGIDILLNGRLRLAGDVMDVVGLSLFGRRIDIKMVENAYLASLYSFGIIPLGAEIIIYMYALKRSMDSRDGFSLVCLLVMALHGLAEAATFDPFFNVALLSVFSQRTNSYGGGAEKGSGIPGTRRKRIRIRI